MSLPFNYIDKNHPIFQEIIQSSKYPMSKFLFRNEKESKRIFDSLTNHSFSFSHKEFRILFKKVSIKDCYIFYRERDSNPFDNYFRLRIKSDSEEGFEISNITFGCYFYLASKQLEITFDEE